MSMRLTTPSCRLKHSWQFHRPAEVRRLHASHRSTHSPIPGLRFISTSSQTAVEARSVATRSKNFLLGLSLSIVAAFGYYYITDTRAGVHQWLVVPSLCWLYKDAEDAHEAGTKALKGLYEFGIHPRERGNFDDAGDLQVEGGAVQVFGHTLANPIGTSAGIDKHAEIPSALLALGPAIVEIGGATPYPQDGNPKPRVFRLPSQKALINRYGLNSEGADNMAMRLRQRVREYAYSKGFGIDKDAEQRVLDGDAGVPPGSLVGGKLMAVQVAKNSFTPDDDIEAIKKDYVYCVDALARYSDIIVVNVSSPNTPGLRGLQRMEPLTNILKGVVEAAKRVNRKSKPAVMCKVSPDEDTEGQIAGICEAIWESGADGVIVGNTTKRRSNVLPEGYTLSDREARLLLEQGGYSGPQLFGNTVRLVSRYRKLLDELGHHNSSSTSSPPHATRISPNNSPNPSQKRRSGEDLKPSISEQIEATVQRDIANLKDSTAEAENVSKSHPLIRIPERNNPLAPSSDNTDSSSTEHTPALSLSTHLEQLPLPNTDPGSTEELPSSAQSPIPLESPSQRKVIFASGGITNGKQALEALKAGADICQIYTALVYSGVGTISRIKGEMRQELSEEKRRRT